MGTLSPEPDISVVAPAMNEQAGIGEFVVRVSAACESTGQTYEIVLIDDGSTDQTWQRMQSLAAAHDRLVCVKLSRNHGHQLALTAGLSICRGQRILIIDADLQDPPELLPQMLALMDQGADVVYAQRRQRDGETPFKKITASLFYRCIERLSETRIPRDTGDFRLMSRRALDVLLQMPERRRFIRGMVSWIGFKQVPILYDRAARATGSSKFSTRKMLRFAVDAITSFSVRPLFWSAYCGAGCGMLGLLALAGAITLWISGHAAAPWLLLVGVSACFAGLQLLMVGLLGLYVGRLADESRARPLYIIEQIDRSPPRERPVVVVRPEAASLARS